MKNIDLQKNKDKLKNKITYRIFILVGCGIFIPLIFLFGISWRFYYNTIQYEKDEFMSNLRLEENKHIKQYYLDLENEMKELIVQEEGRLDGINLKKSYVNILNRKLGVENVILLDDQYNILYNVFDFDTDYFKEEFLDIFFSKPFYVGQLKRFDNEYKQYLYYKFSIDKKDRYLAFRINDTFFNKDYKLKEGFNFEIINKDFHLINNENRALRKIAIDGITKKMLDGDEGIANMDNNRFSFGNVRVNNFYLYTRVYYDRNDILQVLSKYIFLFSFIMLFSITGYVVIFWSLRKNMIEYTKSAIRIGIEEESDSRYPYLKYELVNLFDHTDNLVKSLNHIESFYYDIRSIKDRIISQNELLIKKKEEKEKIIDKVKSDKDLLDEIKNIEEDEDDNEFM
ncbi:hypothetical protein WG909_10805 [Peptostreptococcaceae bacterium AGR-M142]